MADSGVADLETVSFEAPEDLRRRAAAAVRAAVGMGVEAYRRELHLPRLIPVDPAELTDPGPAIRRKIIARLARALRSERTRGRAGHWTYDLNRHIGLRQAYSAELGMLAAGSGRAKQERPPRDFPRAAVKRHRLV
jgi:hypothetical protein